MVGLSYSDLLAMQPAEVDTVVAAITCDLATPTNTDDFEV